VSRFAAYGISLELPPGWEGRAFHHRDGEPTVHVASFPLPAADGEFGTAATAGMSAEGVFVALTEYRVGPHDLEQGIFAASPPHAVDARLLSARTLLRPVGGQRGLQRFFSTAGRAFCLYVVVGARGGSHLAAVNQLLRSLHVAARPAT
jgi:hypothetical protein